MSSGLSGDVNGEAPHRLDTVLGPHLPIRGCLGEALLYALWDTDEPALLGRFALGPAR